MRSAMLGTVVLALAHVLLGAAGEGPPPVVVISVDALGGDYLRRPDDYGLKIPNLRRIQKEGAWARGVTGVLPTVTYASHSTLVTGVAPARHGVLYNETFDPLDHNKSGWYWYAEDLRVPALWDVATQAGLDVSSVDWPVTVGAKLRWNIVQYWRSDFPNVPDDRKLSRALSTPGLLDAVEKAVGPYPSGYAFDIEADRRRAAVVAWLLETHHPRLQLAYFSALDEEAHEWGPDSPQALGALEAIDGLIGEVRAAAEKAGGGRAVVAVVSDHGQSRVTRELRLNEVLRAAGLILLDQRGKPSDWKAIAWGTGGTAAILLKDPADAATRGKVAELLERLRSMPESPVDRILDGNEARAAGGFPDAAFVVAVKTDVSITDTMEEPITGRLLPQGEHGHLPEHAEMDASFLLAGPGVPAGRALGQIDMRDVAPTLAGVLGLRMPRAEGRDLLAGERK